MKKTLFILITSLLFLLPTIVYAAPDASPSAASLKDKQVEDLKDRLATKVAQLSQSQRSAISGPVKATSITSFTVETKTKDMKIELADSIKVFQYLKGKRTTLTLDDIEKGDNVVVFGVYDTTLDLIKASIVFIDSSHEVRVSGKISAIDKTDFTITVQGAGNTSTLVDVEKTTRAFDWVTGKGLEKGGFSKLTVGAICTVTGSLVPKETNRMSASRIVQVVSPEEYAASNATPSATIKPTGKLTPTPTKTATP
jgi:hypothetical protein